MLDPKNCTAAGDASSKCDLDILGEIKRALSPEVMRELPEQLRQHTVDVLYDANNWCSTQCDPDFRDEYNILSKELENNCDIILSFVPAEKKKLIWTLIDKLYSTINLMNHYEHKMSFRRGLRDGFHLAKFFEGCSPSELTSPQHTR